MTPVDRIRSIALVAITGVAVLASAARAQSAEAEALFRDGRALIKAGKIADGCAKLAASERIDSSVGTLLNLGDCNEDLGRTASAWAAFRKAEAAAKRAGDDDKRMVEARRRAIKLEKMLANLTIEVPHPVDGQVVRRDGDEIDAAVWNTAVPVDPGTYELVAEAPGHRPWRTKVIVNARIQRDVIVPPLDVDVRAAAGIAPAPPVAGGAVAIAVMPGRRSRGTWTGTRKLAVGLAVVGAGAAAGGGIYFGMRARDLQDQADQRCPTRQCNDPDGLRLNDEAQQNATRSNVFLIAGGATVALATVLWFVGAPHGEVVVAPAVGDGRVGVSLAGSF